MHRRTLDRLLHKALQSAIALGAARGCCIGIPDELAVHPIPAGMTVPAGASGRSNDPALNAAQCSPLCGAYATSCRIVHLCRMNPDAGPDANASLFGAMYPCSATESSELGVLCTHPGVCIGGRLSAGYTPRTRSATDAPLGALLAEQHRLEHASIGAFTRLARELRLHRAPAVLLRACRAAARDERRHALALRTLAHRERTRVQPLRRAKGPARSLFECALENVVEGCVRETYGALLALWQAAHASDRELARVCAKLARDEARHAALAWSLDAWARTQLTEAERAQLDHARERTFETLARELEAEPHAAVRERAGYPSAAQARVLLESMREGVAQAA